MKVGDTVVVQSTGAKGVIVRSDDKYRGGMKHWVLVEGRGNTPITFWENELVEPEVDPVVSITQPQMGLDPEAIKLVHALLHPDITLEQFTHNVNAGLDRPFSNKQYENDMLMVQMVMTIQVMVSDLRAIVETGKYTARVSADSVSKVMFTGDIVLKLMQALASAKTIPVPPPEGGSGQRCDVCGRSVDQCACGLALQTAMPHLKG